MRRIGRYIRSGLTALSLVLCVVVAALWITSIHLRSSLRYLTRVGDLYQVETVPHRLRVSRLRDAREFYAGWDPVPAGTSIKSEPWGKHRDMQVPKPAPSTSQYHSHDSYLTVVNQYVPLKHRIAGFGWESRWYSKPPAPRLMDYLNYTPLTNTPAASYHTTLVDVPFWFLICIVLVTPLLRARWHWRRHQWRKQLRCVKCGYDLRATPDRCPECGTIPTKVKA